MTQDDLANEQRAIDRLRVICKALKRLQTLLLAEEGNQVIRDAAMPRFKSTVEALWKAAQAYLRAFEGLDRGSPKGVVRASLQFGLLTKEQVSHALAMTDERNLTVHTYNEGLAKQIFARVSDHVILMNAWLSAMEAQP